MSQPFYHIRPNKHIDRYLFISCLNRLNSIVNIRKHRYIGFGSYYFDDFKQIHDELNITSMISLESDQTIFKRASFNVPYKCIKVVNQTSTDYISGSKWGKKKNIIWLDYNSPSDIATQFSDVAALTNIMNNNDVFRVTFNANVASLGSTEGSKEDPNKLKQFRLENLKTRIGEHFPTDITANDFTSKKYPLVILRCFKKMIEKLFVETKYDPRFLLPLFSTVYKDGQTMVTFTGIVLENHNDEKRIKKEFKDLNFVNFAWDKPSIINIPELTTKEILKINQLLPSKKAKKQLIEKFNFIFDDAESEIDSYISFYKYYPSFQMVNF